MGKSMVLKAKSSDIDESSNNEDSKMKSCIVQQFKNFMKNVSAKGFDKDRKQSSSSSSRTRTMERRMLGMAISTLFP